MESKRHSEHMEQADRTDVAQRRVIEAELEQDPDNEFLWDLLMTMSKAA